MTTKTLGQVLYEAQTHNVRSVVRRWDELTAGRKSIFEREAQAVAAVVREQCAQAGDPHGECAAEIRSMREALDLLACLHPGLTVDDGEHMRAAQAIFDQVQSERMECAKEAARLRDTIRLLMQSRER